MIWRMGYMFIMMLTGLAIRTMVIVIRWVVFSAEDQLQTERRLATQPISYRIKAKSSVLFFIPSKLKAKLT